MNSSIESKFSQLHKLYTDKKISEKEYATLVKNMNLESIINKHSKSLQKKNDIYEAMIAAVAIAKTVL
jgi:hypothetical protein